MPRGRRLGLITTSYPRTPDDPAGGFAAEHAAWLARAGWDVDVVCAGDRAAIAGEPERWANDRARGAIAITRVAAPGGLFYAGGAPDALEAGTASAAGALWFSARLAVRALARAGRWDAAIAHWLIPCGVIAALAPRIPVLAIAHGGDVHTLRRVGGTNAVAALMAARGVRLVFVSHSLRAAFARAVTWPGASRALAAAITCPMGIDVGRFAALRRPRLERADRPPTVLFLGRLVAIKGADVLLAAARQVRRPLHLMIAGDGPERGRLEALARGLDAWARSAAGAPLHRVSFVGEVRGEARDRAIAAADVAVIPSRALASGRAEGMPVTALELMAAGVPVIASRTGGLAEIGQPAADGGSEPPIALVEPDDPAALARAIAAMVGEAAADRDHGASARGRRIAAQIAAGTEFAARRDWSCIGPRLAAHMR